MKRRAALLASIGISLAVLIGALVLVDTGALWSDLRRLEPGLVLLGLGVLALNYWLRTLRFRLLLTWGGERVRGLFGVVCLYASLNYLLPARLGELSLPLLLKRVANQEYGIGTASLVAARALDLVSVLILLPLALALSHAAMPGWALRSALIFFAVGSIGTAAALFWLRRQVPAGAPLAPGADGLLGRLRLFGSRVTGHLALISRRDDLLPLTALSLGIWLFIALNFWVILAAAGLQVPIVAAFVVTVVMIPLSILPAQGFANLGTHEVAWLSVLLGFGVSADVAARATLVSHLVLVGYVLVMGALGWALVARAAGRARDA
jgi:uncharacterized membrane protein YbhN (UPF0104 family)